MAVYDGFQSPIPFGTRFDMLQLAPDGKIYLNCPGGNDVLHVIHKPNELGLACEVEQHGVKLPTHNSSSMPNFPNFRLGVLEGSPCDTLPPLARFAFDTIDLQVNFRDQSQRHILSWEWDFGDGITSTDQHPIHEYSTTGEYKVCLNVSNNNGADSICQQIPVMTTGIKKPDAWATIFDLYPNPARALITIRINKKNKGRVLIHDALGRLVREAFIEEKIQFKGLASGWYYCSLYTEEGRYDSQKFVIIK